MTQQEIDSLITCAKKITSSKRVKFKSINRSKRLTMEACTEDDTHKLEVFIRQSEKFEERFSIGLKYISKEDEDFNLVRYNGEHKDHTNKFSDGKKIESFHKHFAKEEIIAKGIRAEHHSREADYVTFKGAILHFFKELNFTNYKEYLKIFDIEEEDPNQLAMFKK
ncbi:MAG: hypothetical protein HYU69_08075 [Bacteroidetes bacterium]|nr:hypothetical protein [Bacteroidota bacterium]